MQTILLSYTQNRAKNNQLFYMEKGALQSNMRDVGLILVLSPPFPWNIHTPVLKYPKMISPFIEINLI